MVQISQLRGIRNAVPSRQIDDDELEAAVNVDLNDEGKARRRTGRTLFSTGAADSLFQHDDVALFRRSSALQRLNTDGTTESLQTGIENPIVYAAAGDRVFWSDTVLSGIVENGVSGPWGITPPPNQPDYVAGANGNLPLARYLYAVTFIRDGLESGTGPSVETVDLQGSIDFSSIPVPADATQKVIYLSRPNGRELYRALILDAATTTATYSGDTTELGAKLETQFRQPPPAGHVLAEHNGRVLVGIDRFLLYSDPFRPDLFDPVRMSYRFASAVNLIAPVQGGVYVGTEKSIEYLAGDDIGVASRDVKAGYGTVPGTVDYTEAQHLPEIQASGECAIFASQKGICLGANDGSFTNLTLNRYVYPSARTGAGIVRLEDGKNRYVVVLRGV